MWPPQEGQKSSPQATHLGVRRKFMMMLFWDESLRFVQPKPELSGGTCESHVPRANHLAHPSTRLGRWGAHSFKW